MAQRARELGVAKVEIDLLSGTILTAGFDAYRHQRLASIAHEMYLRGTQSVLPAEITQVRLVLQLTGSGHHLSIAVETPSAPGGCLIVGI